MAGRLLHHARGRDQDQELARQIDTLRGKGVHFLICRNTLEGMKLALSDLYGVKEEDVVPSGVAEIARLQGMGFVYLHPRDMAPERDAQLFACLGKAGEDVEAPPAPCRPQVPPGCPGGRG
ncbi:DsrE family protein [Nitrospirillum iridis]|uniref:Uncharacterized protein n=1 Tax=Nitrospirillum iridis TaxID=765888 RepID=A0A7X0EEK8_9PROT|nr:DsrE family protein [Nitrospirillum iridis]MBB6253140.1 hypothetical protein [Nitrospirillum iridis]